MSLIVCFEDLHYICILFCLSLVCVCMDAFSLLLGAFHTPPPPPQRSETKDVIVVAHRRVEANLTLFIGVILDKMVLKIICIPVHARSKSLSPSFASFFVILFCLCCVLPYSLCFIILNKIHI